MTTQTFSPGVAPALKNFVVSEEIAAPAAEDLPDGSVSSAVKDILLGIRSRPRGFA